MAGDGLLEIILVQSGIVNYVQNHKKGFLCESVDEQIIKKYYYVKWAVVSN